MNCKNILTGLDESPFIYKTIILFKKETIKAQCAPFLPNPGTTYKMIIMLDGNLYPEIETAEVLLEELKE